MSNPSKTEHATNVRLAESDYAAVDMCHCGALQLHLGDLSLRLPPDLVLSLTRTLTVALARRQSILGLAERAEDASMPGANWGGSDTPRGKA
ncbi:MAG: hypothetical protein WDO69_18200 [Pseudomonadota bacterium]